MRTTRRMCVSCGNPFTVDQLTSTEGERVPQAPTRLDLAFLDVLAFRVRIFFLLRILAPPWPRLYFLLLSVFSHFVARSRAPCDLLARNDRKRTSMRLEREKNHNNTVVLAAVRSAARRITFLMHSTAHFSLRDKYTVHLYCNSVAPGRTVVCAQLNSVRVPVMMHDGGTM